MMWVYAVKAKEVCTSDLHSLEELEALEKNVDWFWIDCMEPSSKEFEIVSELLCNEPKMLDDIKRGKTFPRYKKHNDCTLLSISVAAIQGEMKTYPIYIAVRGKMLLTLRSKMSSMPIESAIQTLQDCLAEVEEAGPSFVVCEVLRETSNKDLEAMMALREMIEKVEEEAFAKPSNRALVKKVFALKRDIAALYRLLWSEDYQMMSSLKDGLIPNIEPCKENILGLEDTMSNISRELEFLSSYDRALDSVLTIQDLGMIHRVEKTLIYLTLFIVIMNLILIILALAF